MPLYHIVYNDNNNNTTQFNQTYVAGLRRLQNVRNSSQNINVEALAMRSVPGAPARRSKQSRQPLHGVDSMSAMNARRASKVFPPPRALSTMACRTTNAS